MYVKYTYSSITDRWKCTEIINFGDFLMHQNQQVYLNTNIWDTENTQRTRCKGHPESDNERRSQDTSYTRRRVENQCRLEQVIKLQNRLLQKNQNNSKNKNTHKKANEEQSKKLSKQQQKPANSKENDNWGGKK